MIYTVTFSPAIDYVLTLDELCHGEINIANQEKMLLGGKGINVSVVLSNLGRKSVAMGFIAGFVGEHIKNELDKKGIAHDFIEIEGCSRINIKIRDSYETSINGQGPRIGEEDVQKITKKLERLTSSDILVLAGAIPSTLPSDVYQRILEHIKKQKVQFVVDARKDVLLKTLSYHPLLVKPNKDELEEAFGKKISTKEELLEQAKKLIELGSQNVIVSLGEEGALLVEKDGSDHFLNAPKGKLVNSVGAGDSLVAGFLDAYSEKKSLFDCLKEGICSGSASAFSEELASKEEVERLLKNFK